MKLAGAVLLSLSCASLETAAQALQRQPLNLPAGRLGDALAALGRQAKISIGLSDPALAQARVQAVRGNLTVEEALRRLLGGRNARVVTIDATTIRIVGIQATAPRPKSAPPPPAPPPVKAARPAPVRPAEAPPEPADIIVLASRRAVPLASYPGSVSIVDGGDPAFANPSRGTYALISRLPSLNSTHLGPGRNKLFLRGISESSFNGPTQALVGQYLGEVRLNYNAPDPDLRLADLERVEVLAGPQGTLYGAGSLGGIIRLVPNAPNADRAAGALSVGASKAQHGGSGTDFVAVLNTPLVGDRLALRISGYRVSEPGYIDDAQRGLKDVNRVGIAGGRLALRSEPDPHWTVDLAATMQRIRGEDAQYAERGQGRLTRRSSVAQDYGNDYFSANLVGAREWDDFRFVATAGAVRQALRERYDATQSFIPPTVYHLTTGVSLFSSEARLSRQGAAGTGWVAGAAFLSNRSKQTRDVEQGGVTRPRNRVENNVDEAALFGEGSIGLLPGLAATLGGRLVHARLASSGFPFQPGLPLPKNPVEASRSDTRFLPAAALSLRAAPDLLLYGRYQESFRPGGLAIFGLEFTSFRPDKLRAVEAGVRYGSPGRDLFDASAALAYTRWSDIQADTLDNFAEQTTANVGDARIYTADVSLGWRPLAGLALEAAAVVNDSKLKNVAPIFTSASGRPLPGVARLNGRLAAHYSLAAARDLDVRFSAAARYAGRSNLGAGDFLRKPQGDWLDVSLDLEATAGRHTLSAGVTNLLDTDANRFALGSPFTIVSRDFTTPVRPRTLRLGWQIRF